MICYYKKGQNLIISYKLTAVFTSIISDNGIYNNSANKITQVILTHILKNVCRYFLTQTYLL